MGQQTWLAGKSGDSFRNECMQKIGLEISTGVLEHVMTVPRSTFATQPERIRTDIHRKTVSHLALALAILYTVLFVSPQSI